MKFGYKISKTIRWVKLGEDISRLVSRGDGKQLEIAFLEMLASDVAVEFNVLGAFMEDIIISNVDSTTIVTIKRSGSGLWSIHVSQELAKPDKLASGIGKGTILSLNTRTGNTSCFLLRHETREVLNRKQKPVIEHRSIGLPAQSTFE